MAQTLPADVLATIREFRVCELSTLTQNGTPITWPVAARYFPDQNEFLFTTSISLRTKANNIARNPKVGLLFSDPTGSGLSNPPYVMVKGNATVLDGVHVSTDAVDGLEEYWLESIFKRQPDTAIISSNAVMRWLMDWYYMRLVMRIVPVSFAWWENGDMSKPPQTLEVAHVG